MEKISESRERHWIFTLTMGQERKEIHRTEPKELDEPRLLLKDQF